MRVIEPVGHGSGAQDGAGLRLARAAHEFEAQIMKELIQPMTRSAEDEDGTESGGPLTEFAGEALAQALSRSGGFGIADRIVAALDRNEIRR